MKIVVKSFRIIYKTYFIVRNEGLLITLKNGYERYKTGGRKGVTKGINNGYKQLIRLDEAKVYQMWIEQNEHHLEADNFDFKPLISIVMPVYNTEAKWLKEAIDSVINQGYENWELSIADDASTSHETIKVLKRYEQHYQNIKVCYRVENGHISKASNDALALASGEYVAFLDHDDTLAPFALAEVVKVLNKNKNLKLIYSDEDKIDENNRRFAPHFKSDWNLDMFFSQNYVSHLTVLEKSIIDKTEKFRVGYEGAQDYDLLLQCLKFINKDEIEHISKILYHWRAIEGSTALDDTQKNYTTDAGIKALASYFKDEKNVTVSQGVLPNTFKVNYPLIGNPLVSIIIPTKDNHELLKQCVSSIVEKTLYQYYEIIIVDNQTTQEEALIYLDGLSSVEKITILNYDDAFNYAKINNYAVSQAKGDYVVLLNNDIKIINTQWLNEMLQQAQRKEVGVVGAKLYYEDMTIQHAGVVLGIGGVAGHVHKYFSQDAYGYFSRLQIIQNYSAVTGACMMIKKSYYLEVGGLEEKLEVAFNDIDFCLKVLIKGYRNLWTPYARLIHYESKSRGAEDSPEKKERFEKEIAFMKQKWGTKLLEDKCYNRNLTLEHENFSLKIGEKLKKRKSGFTLVELLVVIMIIALLASMVAPNLFGKLDDAQRKTTKSQLANLSTALDSFRLDFGRYPTTDEGLAILSVKQSSLKNWNGPYLTKKLKNDAWDNPYVYKVPGKDGNEYSLLSYGADGKEGGTDKNTDISVWE